MTPSINSRNLNSILSFNKPATATVGIRNRVLLDVKGEPEDSSDCESSDISSTSIADPKLVGLKTQ